MASESTPIPAPTGDRLRRALPWLSRILAGALVLLYLYSAFNRYLINDDYQTLYTAWLRAQGKSPGQDFFLASYYLLVDLIAPLFRLAKEDWMPLYVSRLGLLAALLGTCALLKRMSGPLFSRDAGLIAPLLLLSSGAMLHRGLDLRPDLLTGLLWAIIIARLAGAGPFEKRDAFWMGLLLGFATVNRFKGILIVPLLVGGIGMFALEQTGDRLRYLGKRMLLLGSGCLVALLLYLLPTILSDGLATVSQVHRTLFSDLYSLGSTPNGVRTESILASLKVDFVFWGLAAWGIGLRTWKHREFTPRRNFLSAGLVATAALSVVLNPALYVYNFVTIQILLALFAAYPIGWLAQRIEARATTPRVTWTRMAALLVIPLALQGTQVAETMETTNAHQQQLARFITCYLPKDAPVFALEGVGLYRPSVFHWRFPAILSGRYLRGDWNYVDEFQAAPPELVILSYRVPAWLRPLDSAFLQAHYVPLTPLLYVPGYDSCGRQGPQSFDLLRGGTFEVIIGGDGAVQLDGRTIHPGDRLDLKQGRHLLEPGTTRCMLRHWYPAEARSLVANPQGLPYFTPPGLGNPEPVVNVAPSLH